MPKPTGSLTGRSVKGTQFYENPTLRLAALREAKRRAKNRGKGGGGALEKLRDRNQQNSRDVNALLDMLRGGR